MKLAFCSWIILIVCAINSFAGNGMVSNSPIIVIATTTSTNSLADDSTNEPVAPTHLDQQFTNSADMKLVKVSGSMWAGVFEVTQKEYLQVMGSNPSAFEGNTHPVDSLSFNDALLFCQKMTDLDVKKKAIPDGYHYDLPTEEEWTSLVGGATVENAVTSLNGLFRSGTSPVGSLAPNSLGLYDVLGNVMEFVRTDESKPYRVLKGGSWQDRVDSNYRPEFRWYTTPDEHQSNFGLRVVLRGK